MEENVKKERKLKERETKGSSAWIKEIYFLFFKIRTIILII